MSSIWRIRHRIRRVAILLLSLATTTTAFSLIKTPVSTTTNNRRVFVGGLECVDPQRLQLALEEQFGLVESVFVLRETSAHPYAFVEFAKADDAQRAIGSNSAGALFREIKAAEAVAPHKRKKSAQRRTKAQQDYDNKRQIARESTTLLQIQRSHLDRVQTFLEVHGHRVTGSYGCSSLAILGVQSNAAQLQRFLEELEPEIPIFQCAVRKLYGVDPRQMVEGQEAGLSQCVKTMEQLEDQTARVKLQVFPPAVASQLIQHLQQQEPELLHRLSPTDYSHSLTAIQIPTKETSFWCIGMDKEGSKEATLVKQPFNDVIICRAQSKLQEALARYQHALPSAEGGLVAVDCGAAPGGWTQFLANHIHCRKIYSIDQGELDPTVARHPAVVHLRSKVEHAMEAILEQESVSATSPLVHLWVSDMCLHKMSEQVDLLLQARQQGIVGAGTFFVLTLKCVVGHSRRAFDWQVSEQCDRLKGQCRDLQTMHLFSNRSGERTILGYLK